MKWNIEWADLKNIEYMIAECWRMSQRQMKHYCKDLIYQRELVFAGEIGVKFLEYICRKMDSGAEIDWAKLQKDVRYMQDLIKKGQNKDEHYWIKQYQKLTADLSLYFNTELGDAFTAQVAYKLKLNLNEEQKRLHQDLKTIEKICMACSWNHKSEIRKALSYLSRKEKNVFVSWLGDGFVHIVSERFGMKKKPNIPLEDQKNSVQLSSDPKQQTGKKAAGKAVVWIPILISFGFLCGYLFSQIREGHLDSKLQYLSAVFDQIKVGNTEKKEQEKEPPVGSFAAAVDAGSFSQQTVDQEKDSSGIQQIPDDQTDNGANGLTEGQDPHTESTGTEDEADDPNEDLVSDTANSGQESRQDQKMADSQPDILPQYQSFYQSYPDLFGWICIPGTEIDYPVMQSAEDSGKAERYFYLHRDYAGREDEQGSLFVESKSCGYPRDDNTVIYGHNMSNGRYFGMLEKYKEQSFLKNHPTIEFDTIYETGTYQIAAVLVTRVLYQEEKGFRYYQFYNYTADSEFQDCVDFIRQNQLYDTGVSLQYGDQLLMLSTCEYTKENGRLVVVAKKTG